MCVLVPFHCIASLIDILAYYKDAKKLFIVPVDWMDVDDSPAFKFQLSYQKRVFSIQSAFSIDADHPLVGARHVDDVGTDMDCDIPETSRSRDMDVDVPETVGDARDEGLAVAEDLLRERRDGGAIEERGRECDLEGDVDDHAK